MNNRGANHLEIIISFVLFMGFVSAALILFNPTRSGILIDSSVEYIFREINENSSVVVRTVNTQLGNSNSEETVDCNQQKISIDAGFVVNEEGIYAENYTEGEIESFRDTSSDPGTVVLSRGDSSWEDHKFATIRIAEGIDNTGTGSGPNKEECYEISSILENNAISQKKFDKLVEYYGNNYEDLKDEFNIPDRSDFGFTLIMPNGDEIKAEKSVPEGREVFSEARPVNIIKESGSLGQGDLRVSVW